MNDQQLLHYSRQIMLPQVDYAGQEKLLKSKVLLIGLGGLGAPVALYLAAAGIGHLVLNDFDHVELSNLQRQIIHNKNTIGLSKLASAQKTLQSLNPETQLTLLDGQLNATALANAVKTADIVVDASDNFTTRFLVNRCCVQHQTPLVSGAAIRMEGQICCFHNQADSACYHCLYPGAETDFPTEQNCSENGILAPVVGIIGSMQATEVIKILLGIGTPLFGRLLLLDALHMEWRNIKLRKDPGCPVCQP